mgnify:CR=1 FL=1
MDADWVVLSACNTANTADGPDSEAEGLSGLARAFFYAGSRALLVSHWPVVSVTTRMLMTELFESLEKQPEIGRSEALRQSMLAMATDTTAPRYTHPLFWAPFVVAGEGGR